MSRASPEFVERRLVTAFQPRLGDDDPQRVAALHRADAADAERAAMQPEAALVLHLRLGDEGALGRLGAGELDARAFADPAPPTVAADQVTGPQRATIGEGYVDAGLVLGEAADLLAVTDRHAELAAPIRP